MPREGKMVSPAKGIFSAALWCVPEGRDHLVGASPTRAMAGWPGSWQAVRSGNIPHQDLMRSLARRVVDPDMPRLIKQS